MQQFSDNAQVQALDTYTQAVDNLKQFLKQNKIGYKKIFKLINNEGLIENLDVKKLADVVLFERECIFIKFNAELDNLSALNKRLVQFTREPQLSIKKAKKELAKICINIYDLITDKIDKEVDYLLLKKDVRRHPDRRFPSNIAKKYVNISCFLKRL